MWTKRKAIAEAQNAMETYRQQAEAFKHEAWQVEAEIRKFEAEYSDLLESLAGGILGGSIAVENLEKVAAEWVCPQLLVKYRQLVSLREEKLEERDQLVSHPTVVNRYELLESASASLPSAYEGARSVRKKAEQTKNAFHSKAFDWLYKKQAHKKQEVSGFGKFWKMITLESRRKERFLAEVKSVHHRVYRDVVVDFEAAVAELDNATSAYENAYRDLESGRAILATFDKLNAWDVNFEGIVLEELTKVLAKHLEHDPFERLIVKVPKALRHIVAGMHAVSEKCSYARQLIEYLENEERDRNHRISSINRVRNKWRRNPGGYVRGDKSKWLQDIPRMKSQGTHKRLGWSRSMRSNLRDYDDYHFYGAHYYHACSHSSPFLAFDLFNHRPTHRMPYEGFSGSVISDIGEFRETEESAAWIAEAVEDEYYETYDETWVEAEEFELLDEGLEAGEEFLEEGDELAAAEALAEDAASDGEDSGEDIS